MFLIHYGASVLYLVGKASINNVPRISCGIFEISESCWINFVRLRTKIGLECFQELASLAGLGF